MTDYTTLNRAQLSKNYLHTNSTTHEFLFGALAELVDNARDASATKLQIFSIPDKSVRGGYQLCFLDDGVGMSPEEATDIVTFGKSGKKATDTHMIGMYGNGLKSGSMRIGNDFMLFTKNCGKMTCVFLSRTFHEEENIDEVIVPIPSFDIGSKKSLAESSRDHEKHAIEMRLILKYSPFKTPEKFYRQFDRIEGETGTLVLIFNQKLLEKGDPELDVKTDPYDILLAKSIYDEYDPEESLMPERRSFRAYTAMLYKDPRMRIYIQGKKVRTKRLANCLYKARMYKWHSNRFKSRAENEAKKAKELSNTAEYKAAEAESKARHLESKSNMSKSHLAELRKVQQTSQHLRFKADRLKDLADRKLKELKDPKSLTFTFGVNLENRQQDGAFIYNCSRLIKMYERIGPQLDGGVFCAGVVAIVDVPYLVLEPTHNKQDFADSKEYAHLKKAMGMHMTQYWRELNIVQQGVTNFWESYGYIDANWKNPASRESMYLKKRAKHISVTLQCDKCLKWRILPYSADDIGKDFPDDWVCSMNTDPAHNECHHAEQKMNFPEGIYKKEIKSKGQKEKELEEQINKKKEKLAGMKKTRVVSSLKNLDEDSEPEEIPSPPKKQAVVKPSPISTPSTPRVSIKPLGEEYSKPKPSQQVKPVRSRTVPSRYAPDVINETRRKIETKIKPVDKPLSRPEIRNQRPESLRPEIRDQRPESLRPEIRHERKHDFTELTETKTRIIHQKTDIKKAVPAIEIKRAKVSNDASTPFKILSSTRVKLQEEVKPVARVTKQDSPAPTENKNQESKATKRKIPPPVSKGTDDNIIVISEDNEESEPEEVPKKKAYIQSDESNLDLTVELSSSDESKDTVSKKVQVKLRDEWHSGTVVREDKKQGKWKIKFDRNPRDKYDKWFATDSTDVRVLIDGDLSDITGEETSDETDDKQGNLKSDEAATGSGSGSGSSRFVLADQLAKAYSTCLRYFLPPDWKITKEDVAKYSHEELVDFPLNEFFEHYEEGLKKLVSKFQTDAASEAETANNKLSNVRNLVATLLKAMNEEDIVIEDGDPIDECLAACVQQLQHGSTDD